MKLALQALGSAVGGIVFFALLLFYSFPFVLPPYKWSSFNFVVN